MAGAVHNSIHSKVRLSALSRSALLCQTPLVFVLSAFAGPIHYIIAAAIPSRSAHCAFATIDSTEAGIALARLRKHALGRGMRMVGASKTGPKLWSEKIGNAVAGLGRNAGGGRLRVGVTKTAGAVSSLIFVAALGTCHTHAVQSRVAHCAFTLVN